MNITVKESDLQGLGNTTYSPSNGHTSFICDGQTYAIELIFIRSILEPLGFKVLSVDDYCYENDKCDVEILTTYPWDKYINLKRDF